MVCGGWWLVGLNCTIAFWVAIWIAMMIFGLHNCVLSCDLPCMVEFGFAGLVCITFGFWIDELTKFCDGLIGFCNKFWLELEVMGCDGWIMLGWFLCKKGGKILCEKGKKDNFNGIYLKWIIKYRICCKTSNGNAK